MLSTGINDEFPLWQRDNMHRKPLFDAVPSTTRARVLNLHQKLENLAMLSKLRQKRWQRISSGITNVLHRSWFFNLVLFMWPVFRES